MRKFGVKLWSSNAIENYELVKEISKALKEGVFDFIELFAVPGLFEETHKIMHNEFSNNNVIIHASHSGFGFDTGDKEKLPETIKQFSDAQRYADLFKSDIIVTHTGMGNDPENLDETIRQFKILNDSRIAVENLPSYCSLSLVKLHGITPNEIKTVINEVGCKFCLDFSHAICAANALGVDKFQALDDYFKLNPSMYHICDGYLDSIDDDHLHYGHGNYPLKDLMAKYTKSNSIMTMETGGKPNGIQAWVDDITYLRNTEKSL